MSLRRFGRITAAIAATTLTVGTLGACSAERADDAEEADDTTMVGIAMPTRSLERWNNDGENLDKLLTDSGYETSLQYADNQVDQQITQIQNMINKGADILVIASIDGTALAPVLANAAEEDITVIAYDRLINETENVDYYATFDNERVGTMQGEYIVEQLGLEDGEEGPFLLEPFAGSPDDNNARFFFKGAWDVLSPYVEDGVLEVPSGKAPATVDDWTEIGIQGWASADAQSEMENRLNSFYSGDEKVDVVLSPNDSLALGVEQALEGAGYTPGDDWPLITGQDADEANVKNILADKQSMTIVKNFPELGQRVATMVEQIAEGEEVEVNDTESYDNGVKVVPSYLLDPEVVTKENMDLVVEYGLHEAEDIGL